jgi:hypothetical protein
VQKFGWRKRRYWTMKFMRQFLVVLLSCLMASAAFAERSRNVFTKVRYNGGSVPSKVDPKEWGNKLTVTSDTITLELKGEKKSFEKFEIPSKSVTGSVTARKLIVG